MAIYQLDNEPALWNSTHRDVHPAAVTYDEKVRKEGTIVTARVRSAADAERVSTALTERGALRVSRLPQPGLED